MILQVTYSSFVWKYLILLDCLAKHTSFSFLNPWQRCQSDSQRSWMRLINKQNVMTEELNVTKEAAQCCIITLYFFYIFILFLKIICLGIKCFFEGIFQVDMFLGALCSWTFSPLGRLTEPQIRNKRQVIFLQKMWQKIPSSRDD